MGELIKRKQTVIAQASQEYVTVQTMGGRMHVRWDHEAQATPHGQIVYFAEFLATAGIFDNWVKTCPLHYTSPNASRARDVLGVLSGSKRYAHLAGIRGDQVAAQALGLNKIVSEDSVRRALCAMDPEASQAWMQQALKDSVIEALDRSWILDMQLRSGKEHSSGHGKAGLAQLLDELGARGPALVRGDSGYGNQDIIEICEQHNRRYLLRLRKTANVKRLIERLFNRQDWSAANEASQGWPQRRFDCKC